MTTLTDEIFSQLSRADVQQIGAQLGTGQAQTAGAIAAALPMILGAMGRNTAQPQGAEALLGALGRDHASGGGIGDILGAVLGGQQSRQTDGLGQLGHIFGGQLPRAEAGLGQATGLGGDKAQMLLKILAPIVLAYLSKRMFGGAQAQGLTSCELGGRRCPGCRLAVGGVGEQSHFRSNLPFCGLPWLIR